MNFTIQDFNALSRGTYNAGELTLDKKGRLAIANNHVHFTSWNTQSIDRESTRQIKERFVDALSCNGVDKDEIAKVRQELGLPKNAADGDVSAAPGPLSRHKVREILNRYVDLINGAIDKKADKISNYDPAVKYAAVRDRVNASVTGARIRENVGTAARLLEKGIPGLFEIGTDNAQLNRIFNRNLVLPIAVKLLLDSGDVVPLDRVLAEAVKRAVVLSCQNGGNNNDVRVAKSVMGACEADADMTKIIGALIGEYQQFRDAELGKKPVVLTDDERLFQIQMNQMAEKDLKGKTLDEVRSDLTETAANARKTLAAEAEAKKQKESAPAVVQKRPFQAKPLQENIAPNCRFFLERYLTDKDKPLDLDDEAELSRYGDCDNEVLEYFSKNSPCVPYIGTNEYIRKAIAFYVVLKSRDDDPAAAFLAEKRAAGLACMVLEEGRTPNQMNDVKNCADYVYKGQYGYDNVKAEMAVKNGTFSTEDRVAVLPDADKEFIYVVEEFAKRIEKAEKEGKGYTTVEEMKGALEGVLSDVLMTAEEFAVLTEAQREAQERKQKRIEDTEKEWGPKFAKLDPKNQAFLARLLSEGKTLSDSREHEIIPKGLPVGFTESPVAVAVAAYLAATDQPFSAKECLQKHGKELLIALAVFVERRTPEMVKQLVEELENQQLSKNEAFDYYFNKVGSANISLNFDPNAQTHSVADVASVLPPKYADFLFAVAELCKRCDEIDTTGEIMKCIGTAIDDGRREIDARKENEKIHNVPEERNEDGDMNEVQAPAGTERKWIDNDIPPSQREYLENYLKNADKADAVKLPGFSYPGNDARVKKAVAFYFMLRNTDDTMTPADVFRKYGYRFDYVRMVSEEVRTPDQIKAAHAFMTENPGQPPPALTETEKKHALERKDEYTAADRVEMLPEPDQDFYRVIDAFAKRLEDAENSGRPLDTVDAIGDVLDDACVEVFGEPEPDDADDGEDDAQND